MYDYYDFEDNEYDRFRDEIEARRLQEENERPLPELKTTFAPETTTLLLRLEHDFARTDYNNWFLDCLFPPDLQKISRGES